MKLNTLAILLTTTWLTTLSAATEPPNIILILTDDQGWSQVSHPAHPDMSESKSSYLETPNISRIANEGMLFTRGYSPAPLCTPTRRSIVCGASAARSGSEFASNYIPADHMTLPKALKQADKRYVAAHFGKWGEKMVSTPEECGYDVSDGMTGNNTGGMDDKLKPFHIAKDPKRTGTVTDRAIRFIKQQSAVSKPFYAQISYYAVHLRVELQKKSLEKYQQKGDPDRAYTAGFAGMLGELDSAIGRMLDTVDELGIGDNTYVVFTSDNGGRGVVPGGNAKRLAPNHPLKGAKHSLDEGGLRVPFYVRGPGIDAKSVSHEPVCGYDLLPTFYELAGGNEPLPSEVDGGSFAGLLQDPSTTDIKRRINGLVFHRPRRLSSVLLKDEYKLFLKWDRMGRVSEVALYDVLNSPLEDSDIASRYPEKVAELQRQLVSYLTSVNAEKVVVAKNKKARAKK